MNFRLHVIQGLLDRGFHVIVIGQSDSTTPELLRTGVEVRNWHLKPHSSNVIVELLTIIHFGYLVIRSRPSLLLTFTIKPNLYGGLISRCLGIPQIGTVTGLGTLFLRPSIGKSIFVVCSKVFWRKSFFIFQNQDDQKTYRDLRLVRFGAYSVIPGSGVDTKIYHPGLRKQFTDSSLSCPFTFVYVGRLIKSKGVLDLLDASVKLHEILKGRQEGERLHFRVLFFGQLSSSDMNSISPNELIGYTRYSFLSFRGYCSEPGVMYSQADCVILPSLGEGLPRCLAEAATIGIPMVATNVRGSREIVIDGINGFLVEPGDTESIAEGMLRMISLSCTARESLSLEARRRSQPFSSDNITNEYLTRVDQSYESLKQSLFTRRTI